MSRLGLLGLGMLMLTGCYPSINDLSTDRDDPPQYLVAPPERSSYRAAALREPTERAYPQLHNRPLPQPPEAVFNAVAALVGERGWREVAREAGDPARGTPWRLQAVAVTRLLRFKDDVLVEVRPGANGGSTVAMRSKSRVGRSDLGTNARRILAFLADLNARIHTAPTPEARP